MFFRFLAKEKVSDLEIEVSAPTREDFRKVLPYTDVAKEEKETDSKHEAGLGRKFEAQKGQVQLGST